MEHDVRLRQLKVSLNPEIISVFKNSCAKSGVSMASVISQFMIDYSIIPMAKKNVEPDYSTRRRRRAAVVKISKQLEQVRDCEQAYCDRIPENLQSSVVYDRAEEFISCLDIAIDALAFIE